MMMRRFLRRVTVGSGLILATSQFSAADHAPDGQGNWFCTGDAGTCCQDGSGICLINCVPGSPIGWYYTWEINCEAI